MEMSKSEYLKTDMDFHLPDKWQAKWIGADNVKDVCPVFRKCWKTEKEIRSAHLLMTAYGVYEAWLNRKRISYFMAPGWTAYETRLQVQRYDITDILREENTLDIYLGKGWFASDMPGWVDTEKKRARIKSTPAILAEIHILYQDGTQQVIATDHSWKWGDSGLLFSEIYDGEIFDAGVLPVMEKEAAEYDYPYTALIPQEGEIITEHERIRPRAIIKTPAGETVVDFGQEITGYVEISVHAKAGETIELRHGEMLDKDGNFYNANYRSAKAQIRYVCRDGQQIWHPSLTFFGFRYVLVKDFPGEVTKDCFTAVAVSSSLQRTGFIETGHKGINKLISNVFWSQKDNFLDVPTDCPQRDERLGWTGDAQVFVKAASYNYDVERFFRKWLRDLAAEQRADGAVGQVIPDYLPDNPPSAAWGDAAVICPWQIYQTYGNRDVLSEQFSSMKSWVDYITAATTTEGLWTGGEHFGDWLGLDAPTGSYKGSSREDLIASAFYYHSASLVCKAGQELGEDVKYYETLSEKILTTFRQAFPDFRTQTEYALAIQFELAENRQKCADELADLIIRDGTVLKTGFVGTPYLLHVLSDYGHAGLAYQLLLREKYPSWLYPVSRGATTIWEHWDGLMENGEFWSPDMNSFNHYAYGSVIDWIYEKAAGIRPAEGHPGFSHAQIAPIPAKELGFLRASIKTRHGLISSYWIYEDENTVRYEIKVPVPAEILIGAKQYNVSPGKYVFFSEPQNEIM